MAFTPEQLEQRLKALQDMRWRGIRDTTIEGRRVTYGSDAELAAAIEDLQRALATSQGRKRRRVVRTYAVKDL